VAGVGLGLDWDSVVVVEPAFVCSISGEIFE